MAQAGGPSLKGTDPPVLTERAECQTKIDNLIDAIENGGHVTLHARIEAKLQAAQGTVKLSMIKEEVRSLVYQSVEDLVGVLKEDAALARKVLHKHIKKLLLYANGSPRSAIAWMQHPRTSSMARSLRTSGTENGRVENGRAAGQNGNPEP